MREGDLAVTAGPLSRLPGACTVLGALVLVFAIVSLPREAFWAFGVAAAVVGALAAAARLGPWRLARRLTVELPFVAFAIALPIVGRGERVDVGIVSLSQEGLWAAWNILAKGTLGVAVTVVLTTITPVGEILRGLERLRLPRGLVMIASFMVRYAAVLRAESERMRLARLSRGYDPRWFWQARAVATSAGTLFVRAYERGERVHLAMLSRGFTGRFPHFGDRVPRPAEWLACLAPGAVVAATSATAWVLR